jgi:hypothetical protein
MGMVIDRKKLAASQKFYRLLIYGYVASDDAVSVNKAIAEELLKFEPGRRTMQLDKCFNKVLDTLPNGVVIQGIDVMFNPDYKVDVLTLLIAANKRKLFSLIWPGRIEDDRLVYSEEGYLDYQVYEISNYDIVCVI